ncbi:2)G26)dimethyltransferase 2) [Durusdinium trenchii]|uniref:tRNA (guanine(26)-N(2))-dimethyltransferase n=1 Tax=Durusdinium trenchii TaxID=1381693 RepID=A0ABP0JBS5_9DINO
MAQEERGGAGGGEVAADPQPPTPHPLQQQEQREDAKLAGTEDAAGSAGEMAEGASVAAGVVPEGFDLITEGKAGILVHKDASVFYNKVQVKNRDLSVFVLNEFAHQLKLEADMAKRLKAAGSGFRKMPEKNEASEGGDRGGAKSGGSSKGGSDGYVGLRVMEALSASGLRSCRYWKEVVEGVGLDYIQVNDVEKDAVDSIKRNKAYNGITSERFNPTEADAIVELYKHRGPAEAPKPAPRAKSLCVKQEAKFRVDKDVFDVVDLDPYGSPSVFLDSAIQAVREGGLLCVTATDLAALCGKNPDMCFTRYGAMPFAGSGFCVHEMALRILLGSMEQTANKYNRYLVPLLSVQMDFYARVFVRVHYSKNEPKRTPCKLAHVYKSRELQSYFLQPLAKLKDNSKAENHVIKLASLEVPRACPHTGAPMLIGGPIWTDPIQNMAFVESLRSRFQGGPMPNGFDASKLDAADLVQGVVSAVAEELVDVPLERSLPMICKTLHCQVPSELEFFSALVNGGYRFSKVLDQAPPSPHKAQGERHERRRKGHGQRARVCR